MNINISEIVEKELNEMKESGDIKKFIKKTLEDSIKDLIKTTVNNYSIKNVLADVIIDETRKAVGEVDINAHNESTQQNLMDKIKNGKRGIFK